MSSGEGIRVPPEARANLGIDLDHVVGLVQEQDEIRDRIEEGPVAEL